MEHIKTLITDHQLDKGLNTLHTESKEWLHIITSWKKELFSMIAGSKKATASPEITAEIRKIADAMTLLDKLLDKLYKLCYTSGL